MCTPTLNLIKRRILLRSLNDLYKIQTNITPQSLLQITGENLWKNQKNKALFSLHNISSCICAKRNKLKFIIKGKEVDWGTHLNPKCKRQNMWAWMFGSLASITIFPLIAGNPSSSTSIPTAASLLSFTPPRPGWAEIFMVTYRLPGIDLWHGAAPKKTGVQLKFVFTGDDVRREKEMKR